MTSLLNSVKTAIGLDPTKHADPDMKRVLDALASLNPKHIDDLDAEEARQQPSAADAALKVQAEDGVELAPAVLAVQTEDILIDGAAGPLAARVYRPQKTASTLGEALAENGARISPSNPEPVAHLGSPDSPSLADGPAAEGLSEDLEPRHGAHGVVSNAGVAAGAPHFVATGLHSATTVGSVSGTPSVSFADLPAGSGTVVTEQAIEDGSAAPGSESAAKWGAVAAAQSAQLQSGQATPEAPDAPAGAPRKRDFYESGAPFAADETIDPRRGSQAQSEALFADPLDGASARFPEAPPRGAGEASAAAGAGQEEPMQVIGDVTHTQPRLFEGVHFEEQTASLASESTLRRESGSHAFHDQLLERERAQREEQEKSLSAQRETQKRQDAWSEREKSDFLPELGLAELAHEAPRTPDAPGEGQLEKAARAPREGELAAQSSPIAGFAGEELEEIGPSAREALERAVHTPDAAGEGHWGLTPREERVAQTQGLDTNYDFGPGHEGLIPGAGSTADALSGATPASAAQATQERGLPSRAGAPLDPARGSSRGREGLPLALYFHGGGFVIADLDTYDATPRSLAAKTGAIFLSAHCRQAPEHKFPAAHDDAFAAYKWALENAESLGADPSKIAILGESAGANLALNVAIRARDEGLPPPIRVELIYPVADTDTGTPSYHENSNARPLDKPMMQWFVGQILEEIGDKEDPRLRLLRADLSNLPPTTVITAGIDPLRSEGEALAERLRETGVQVRHQNYPGATHEFFGMDSVVQAAKEAQGLVAEDLRSAFASEPTDRRA